MKNDEYSPDRLDMLKLLPHADAWSGLPVFQFERDYVYALPLRDAYVIFPKDEKTDGGSIPACFHWFAQPLESRGRVAFVRHDLKYTIQGGLRHYISNPNATRTYTEQPVTRLRADWELFLDYFVSYFRSHTEQLDSESDWLRIPRYLRRICWSLFRAWIILCVVVVCGKTAWNTIELETAPN